jgi:hypothetical protein
MNSVSKETLQDIMDLRDTIATELGGALRELDRLKTALSERFIESATIVAFPSPQSYVMQYRDDHGLSRVAIVRTIIPAGDDLFVMHTTKGGFTVARNDIQEWAPVLNRDNEPYPDGWWLGLT